MPDYSTDVAIIVGVDTHKDIHVAVAIDTLGRGQGQLAAPVKLGLQRCSLVACLVLDG